MARQLNRLSPRGVATLTKPGRHSDGGGLYLSISPTGGRRWVFLFRWNGRLREMGLGGASSVSLAKAREGAAKARAALADGVNPLDAKREAEGVPTFGDFADAVVADLSPQWRNPKHRAQWESTLQGDAARLRGVRLDRVDTADVLGVLKPIWQTKPETAGRLRGRIERVLDAAKAKGHRSGENPARWRGHLDTLLPKRQKLSRGHHAALPFGDVAPFVGTLRERQAVAAMAVEFLILTASRSAEVRGARWNEIDLEGRVWTIPARRMKAGREHRVPLSGRAVEILDAVAPLAQEDADAVVFPASNGKPLSDGAFSALFKRLGVHGQFTPHGFRSSFRDWAGEVSTFPREVAEAALAHTVGDETERAYRRGDALEKRRLMMDAWAGYIEPGRSGAVVPLARRAK